MNDAANHSPSNDMPQSRPGTPVVSQPPQMPQIIVNVGGGRFSRLMSWLAWSGLGLCLLVLIGQSAFLRDLSGDAVDEKYHSGARGGKDKIAIISVTGTILDGTYAKQQIDRVRKDDQVKAIVLRVVSPGGTITGSDYIYHHLTKLCREKELPLVVSMGSIAASGGYYVSMAVGDRPKSIYAEPTTWTGSIGVIIPHYDLSGLLTRFEVKEDSLATHPRKQLMSMTRPLTEDHREVLQGYLDDAFTRFKGVIKEGRPAFAKDPEALNKLATGEVFTALQAKQNGLIDEIGFLEDAIDRAHELAKLEKEQTVVVEYRRQSSLFDLAGLGETKSPEKELARLLELHTPRAYYLTTTLPALLEARQATGQ